MRLTSQRERIKEPTQIDWAQAAAYLDGEGSIIIALAKNRPSASGLYHNFIVDIANTDLRLMHWLLQTFGGWLCGDQASRTMSTRRPCYHWRLRRREYRWFIEGVRLYLHLKTEQADIALAYLNTLKAEGSRHRRLTVEVLSQRENCRQRLIATKISRSDSKQPFRRLELDENIA